MDSPIYIAKEVAAKFNLEPRYVRFLANLLKVSKHFGQFYFVEKDIEKVRKFVKRYNL